MEIEAMIVVLQAALAEKEIERRSREDSSSGRRWFPKPQDEPWDFMNWEYREKPKPREWWVTFGVHGEVDGVFSDLETAKRCCARTGTTARVVEVLT